MSKDEFFAFMPLLLYGIAVSEIVMHWRDYLRKERRYWPHLVTGLILLDLAFVNFYYLYDSLNLLFENYVKFLYRLLPPLVLLLTVSAFTPERESNVKQYFIDKMPTVFTLLAIFIGLNTLDEFGYNFITLIRLAAIIVCLLLALTRKVWLIFLWVTLRISIFVVESAMPHLLN